MLKPKFVQEINVYLRENKRALGGLGEAGTPLIDLAAANTVFAVTGKRGRRLPIRHKDFV